jgi:flagellar biogenesis protein FliO
MQRLQVTGQKRLSTQVGAAPDIQGVACWVLNLCRGWLARNQVQPKQLRLVETLALGGKRQLMLVTCAGESFLVGGGLDSVETIVRLGAEISFEPMAQELDEPCQ